MARRARLPEPAGALRARRCRSSTTVAGCLFVAERGRGSVAAAAVGRRAGQTPGVSTVSDASELPPGRASPSRSSPGHSSRDAGAAVADELGITASPLRMDSQAKYAVVAAATPSSTSACRAAATSSRSGITPRAASSSRRPAVASPTSTVNALDFTAGRRLEHNRGLVVAPAALHAASARRRGARARRLSRVLADVSVGSRAGCGPARPLDRNRALAVADLPPDVRAFHDAIPVTDLLVGTAIMRSDFLRPA